MIEMILGVVVLAMVLATILAYRREDTIRHLGLMAQEIAEDVADEIAQETRRRVPSGSGSPRP